MDRMEAFHILASADRQIILHELSKENKEAHITELSRRVAARRHRIPPEKISRTKIKRARVRLVHDHLPRLQEKGILTIEWDENELSLATGEDVDQLFDAATEVDSWPPEDPLISDISNEPADMATKNKKRL